MMKPNIIYIISDTLRTKYLGCYGNKFIHTPNIDAFAAEATVFDCAYPDEVTNKAWKMILQDAGGQMPIYNMRNITDVIGRRR